MKEGKEEIIYMWEYELVSTMEITMKVTQKSLNVTTV